MPYRRLVIIQLLEITATLTEGGYFFLFVILTTSAIMETIRERSKNNSPYVIISTAPFQRGRKCPLK